MIYVKSNLIKRKILLHVYTNVLRHYNWGHVRDHTFSQSISIMASES
jgi:hypothetical protein